MLDDFIDQDYFNNCPAISDLNPAYSDGSTLFDSADLIVLANEFAWRMEEEAMKVGG